MYPSLTPFFIIFILSFSYISAIFFIIERPFMMVSYLSGAFNSQFYTLNVVDMFVAPEATQDDLLKFKRNACKFYEKLRNIELMYKYGLLL